MKCEATISCKVPELYDAVIKELKTQNRSAIDIKTESDKLIFNIKSEDTVALRATLNAITKLLTVYEKTDEVIEKIE